MTAFTYSTIARQNPQDKIILPATHVTGIAAGNGASSGGKYAGVAAEANIIGVKVLDDKGAGDTADFLAGIQWVMSNRHKYNIRIINMSVGTARESSGLIVKAAERAWDMGIAVCAAAGNDGPAPGTITSPGTSRKIITVGTSDDNAAVSIWGNQKVNFSGRGPTKDCIHKPDILAPGTNHVSTGPLPDFISQNRKRELNHAAPGYVKMSGTSMSTPNVSGALALALEKHTMLSPNVLKLALKHSARDTKGPPNRQGWGALDIDKFLNRLAEGDKA